MAKIDYTRNFMNILNGLNESKKMEAAKFILSAYREKVAVNPNFYNQPDSIQEVYNRLFSDIQQEDVYLEALIRLESSGPYSIFSYIMDQNFSDISIYKNGFMLSNNNNVERHPVADHLLPIYHMFVNHFIDNIIFLGGKKFDTGNSIVDAEIGIFRFNIIHQSLNTNGFHTIIIRKQVVNRIVSLQSGEYMRSIRASAAQEEVIHKHALEGNCVVFGATGSGKTTLVKYMANYGLEQKRNLITIEDTAELGVPVPISLVTNRHKGIKDLFIASLRQNPSHLIVGETRDSTIVDILESALTISVLTTLHANSFERCIQRIIFMSLERSIQPHDMENLIKASIDAFIFMEDRKVKEVWEKKPRIEHDVYDAYQQVE